MKRIVFLSVQAIWLVTAFAQSQMGPAGPAASPTPPMGPVVPAAGPGSSQMPESPGRRRMELRSVLQSPQQTPEQPVSERRLSPAELAQLREQVREQYQGASQR